MPHIWPAAGAALPTLLVCMLLAAASRRWQAPLVLPASMTDGRHSR